MTDQRKPGVTISMLACVATFLLAGSLQAWNADNGDGTYTNPVINADYPDCDVIRVGSDYYYLSSSFHFSPSDPVLHSKDLVNWEVIGYAIPRYDAKLFGKQYDLEEGGAYGRGSWAPTIRYHDGMFYVGYWVKV